MTTLKRYTTRFNDGYRSADDGEFVMADDAARIIDQQYQALIEYAHGLTAKDREILRLEDAAIGFERQRDHARREIERLEARMRELDAIPKCHENCAGYPLEDAANWVREERFKAVEQERDRLRGLIGEASRFVDDYINNKHNWSQANVEALAVLLRERQEM